LHGFLGLLVVIVDLVCVTGGGTVRLVGVMDWACRGGMANGATTLWVMAACCIEKSILLT